MSDIFPQPKSIESTLSDALGHYVYLLIDPRNGKVFYVGKGEPNTGSGRYSG